MFSSKNKKKKERRAEREQGISHCDECVREDLELLFDMAMSDYRPLPGAKVELCQRAPDTTSHTHTS